MSNLLNLNLLFQVLPDFIISYNTILTGKLQCTLNIKHPVSSSNPSKDIVVSLLQVVSDFELIPLLCYLTLDLAVGVIDNGQEHVEQDKEHKEHIAEKEDWPKHSVGILD